MLPIEVMLKMCVGRVVILFTNDYRGIEYCTPHKSTTKGILTFNTQSDSFMLCGENISAHIDDTLSCQVFYKENIVLEPMIELNLFDD